MLVSPSYVCQASVEGRICSDLGRRVESAAGSGMRARRSDHGPRSSQEETRDGGPMGAVLGLQAARDCELMRQEGQPVDYRSIPEVGHSMHGLDPKLFCDTLVDQVASLRPLGTQPHGAWSASPCPSSAARAARRWPGSASTSMWASPPGTGPASSADAATSRAPPSPPSASFAFLIDVRYPQQCRTGREAARARSRSPQVKFYAQTSGCRWTSTSGNSSTHLARQLRLRYFRLHRRSRARSGQGTPLRGEPRLRTLSLGTPYSEPAGSRENTPPFSVAA